LIEIRVETLREYTPQVSAARRCGDAVTMLSNQLAILEAAEFFEATRVLGEALLHPSDIDFAAAQ